MANVILIRDSPSILLKRSRDAITYSLQEKNSTINVRSQGRSQRHYIGGETKGTEIKRFILRREGGASLNQGGVRATP